MFGSEGRVGMKKKKRSASRSREGDENKRPTGPRLGSWETKPGVLLSLVLRTMPIPGHGEANGTSSDPWALYVTLLDTRFSLSLSLSLSLSHLLAVHGQVAGPPPPDPHCSRSASGEEVRPDSWSRCALQSCCTMLHNIFPVFAEDNKQLAGGPRGECGPRSAGFRSRIETAVSSLITARTGDGQNAI